ncbi:hypothetical protein NPJ88_010615 [Halomonas elongata]|uniref:hypothetical protein n=1 Tax=Halomonas elongata TaxID=2746 RepID=UPI00255AA767|nr:hypothetical protein [Halomonas elongata]MDL4862788.1 hypothetical protein [Halomonas elongata]
MYKYLSEKNFQRIMESGSVRIGTLYDFRRQEHLDGIRDEREGTKELFKHYEGARTIEGGPTGRDLMGMISVGVGASVTFKDMKLSRRLSSPDFFVFCMSSRRSTKVMMEFDEADKCYEVVNFERFFKRITASLNTIVPVSFKGVFPCNYRIRREEWNGADYGLHPALIKEPSYAGQFEVRAIWQPAVKAEIYPEIIEARSLRKYVKEVSV